MHKTKKTIPRVQMSSKSIYNHPKCDRMIVSFYDQESNLEPYLELTKHFKLLICAVITSVTSGLELRTPLDIPTSTLHILQSYLLHRNTKI